MLRQFGDTNTDANRSGDTRGRPPKGIPKVGRRKGGQPTYRGFGSKKRSTLANHFGAKHHHLSLNSNRPSSRKCGRCEANRLSHRRLARGTGHDPRTRRNHIIGSKGLCSRIPARKPKPARGPST